MSKEQRELLLQQAQLPVVIPTDHALAVKADLSFPWTELEGNSNCHSLKHCIKQNFVDGLRDLVCPLPVK